MAYLTCAISGIKLQCSHLDSLHLPHFVGYYHPIFAASYRNLLDLYSKHCKGELPGADSYLLFLAFLHISDSIIWDTPASLSATSAEATKLVENNIRQLVSVLARTYKIKHPAFKQPKFKVNANTNNLVTVSNWIAAWELNINLFMAGEANQREYESLVKVENFLTKLIYSSRPPQEYANVIANWADKAARFPPHKAEIWKNVIKSCFNKSIMFNTPLNLIKEIADYCVCNIDAGSIHFNALSKALTAGVTNHIDYLGRTLPVTDFTLLDNSSLSLNLQKISEVHTDLITSIIDNAPTKEPVREDYKTNFEFIKAKLAYKTAQMNKS